MVSTLRLSSFPTDRDHAMLGLGEAGTVGHVADPTSDRVLVDSYVRSLQDDPSKELASFHLSARRT